MVVGSLARQRSRAGSAPSKHSSRWRRSSDAQDDAIFSTNSEGMITSWNRGAETLYQYPADEVLGRHVTLIAPPDRVAEVELNRARLNRGESVASYQTERMRKDGTRVDVMISISPLRRGRGKIIGASAIARDITAQKDPKRLCGEVKNWPLPEDWRHRSRMKLIIHWKRSPISFTWRDTIRSMHRSISRWRNEEVARVAHIAQQTLGFVRESAAATLVDVSFLLDEVLQLYASKLQRKRIQVEKRCSKSNHPCLRRRIAATVLKPDGKCRRCDGTGRLLMAARFTGTRAYWRERVGVRILVGDSGSGIGPEQFEHLFEPFYTTKKDGGTGLGLWLSLGIVRKHGGSIRVRSRAASGKTGTVFSIFLPQTVEATEPEGSAPTDEARLTSHRATRRKSAI